MIEHAAKWTLKKVTRGEQSAETSQATERDLFFDAQEQRPCHHHEESSCIRNNTGGATTEGTMQTGLPQMTDGSDISEQSSCEDDSAEQDLIELQYGFVGRLNNSFVDPLRISLAYSLRKEGYDLRLHELWRESGNGFCNVFFRIHRMGRFRISGPPAKSKLGKHGILYPLFSTLGMLSLLRWYVQVATVLVLCRLRLYICLSRLTARNLNNKYVLRLNHWLSEKCTDKDTSDRSELDDPETDEEIRREKVIVLALHGLYESASSFTVPESSRRFLLDLQLHDPNREYCYWLMNARDSAYGTIYDVCGNRTDGEGTSVSTAETDIPRALEYISCYEGLSIDQTTKLVLVGHSQGAVSAAYYICSKISNGYGGGGSGEKFTFSEGKATFDPVCLLYSIPLFPVAKCDRPVLLNLALGSLARNYTPYRKFIEITTTWVSPIILKTLGALVACHFLGVLRSEPIVCAPIFKFIPSQSPCSLNMLSWIKFMGSERPPGDKSPAEPVLVDVFTPSPHILPFGKETFSATILRAASKMPFIFVFGKNDTLVSRDQSIAYLRELLQQKASRASTKGGITIERYLTKPRPVLTRPVLTKYRYSAPDRSNSDLLSTQASSHDSSNETPLEIADPAPQALEFKRHRGYLSPGVVVQQDIINCTNEDKGSVTIITVDDASHLDVVWSKNPLRLRSYC